MNNIIEHSANGRNYLIVEVPKEGIGFEVYNTPEKSYMDCWVKCHFSLDVWKWSLPTGDYRILFIAEQATHSQVKAEMSATEFVIIVNKVIPENFTDATKHHLILEKI